MNLLVTAGNTAVPIDRVRCITNIFTGRTGARIAACAHGRGHAVTLLTSHPEVASEMYSAPSGWTVLRYRTFDDLDQQLAALLQRGGWGGVIHSAAVSDYRVAGVFAPADGTRYLAEAGCWQADDVPRLTDMAAGKVKSDAPELWLRLTRTPKLIDRIRADWGFGGVLVKFKLEVGVSDEQLLEIAERSRRQSAADFMVANTLEGAAWWAYLGPTPDGYCRVSRAALADRLLEAVEEKHREKSNG
jgi:phosphopantothenate-cysteine ligase/phosphopantothenoylcysteine decarboxylase/phosphopantothenate--cysteine ligase